MPCLSAWWLPAIHKSSWQSPLIYFFEIDFFAFHRWWNCMKNTVTLVASTWVVSWLMNMDQMRIRSNCFWGCFMHFCLLHSLNFKSYILPLVTEGFKILLGPPCTQRPSRTSIGLPRGRPLSLWLWNNRCDLCPSLFCSSFWVTRFVQRCPLPLLESGNGATIQGLVNCAIASIAIEQRDAHNSISKFLNDLLDCGLSRSVWFHFLTIAGSCSGRRLHCCLK